MEVGSSHTSHALRWIASKGDSQTTDFKHWLTTSFFQGDAGKRGLECGAILLTHSVSLLQRVKSRMGNPDWYVSMFNINLEKLPRHAGVKGNDRADTLAAKATITSGLYL